MRLIPILMDCFSKISWRLLASYTWLFCAFAVLFLGLGTLLVEPDGKVFPPMLLVLMIFLSFPVGFGVFLLTWPFIDLFPPLDFFLVWLGIVVAGYVQWFRIVSNDSRGPITLSLAQTPSDALPKPTSTLQKKRVRRKRVVQIIHFDAAGRTPLERAIESNSGETSRRLTQCSSSFL